MTDKKAPKIAKWPFYTADLFLMLVAGWLVYQNAGPLGSAGTWAILGLSVAAAWVSIIPFLAQYKASLKMAEAAGLTTVVEQINDLRTLANQISFATAQWQVVQDQASQTVKAAHEIEQRMTREAQSFSAFMVKANDAEKNHLRLEVDKLRRGEGEWLESAVRLLDHVYALYLGGLRSGQDVLIEQLGNFQNACRESMRRLGLTPLEATADEPFNAEAHQLADGDGKVPEGSRILHTIATGYRFQGQVLRLPLVTVHLPELSNRPETVPPGKEESISEQEGSPS